MAQAGERWLDVCAAMVAELDSHQTEIIRQVEEEKRKISAGAEPRSTCGVVDSPRLSRRLTQEVLYTHDLLVIYEDGKEFRTSMGYDDLMAELPLLGE
jgi:erythromycin esterase-like protein